MEIDIVQSVPAAPVLPTGDAAVADSATPISDRYGRRLSVFRHPVTGTRYTAVDPVTLAALVIQLIQILVACYASPEAGVRHLRFAAMPVLGMVMRWRIRRELRRHFAGDPVWIPEIEDGVIECCGEVTAEEMVELYREAGQAEGTQPDEQESR